MLKVGILGGESTHAALFGQLLNRQAQVLGARAAALWAGDAPALARQRMEQAGIPLLCQDWRQLVQRCDAVMVVTRRARDHVEPALACLAAGKPVFVDKPFAPTGAQAALMARQAQRTRTPLVGGSTLCFLPQTAQLLRLARQSGRITIRFTADWASPYGGWYFYGSHLTDLCCLLCGGLPVRALHCALQENRVTAQVEYDGLQIVLQGEPKPVPPTFTFIKQNGSPTTVELPDYEKDCYACGLNAFLQAAHAGRSVGLVRLVQSAQLLEAIVAQLGTQPLGGATLSRSIKLG